jgi:hypothetical protein
MLTILKDIAAHISPLATLETIRAVQMGDHVEITGVEAIQQYVLKAKTKDKITDIEDTFGMANFGRLNYLLGNTEYKKNPSIKIIKEQRKGGVVPVRIEFSNEDGDFKNVYNFVSSEIVKLKVKDMEIKQPTWTVEFSPNLISCNRFKEMSGAFTKEPVFRFKVENDNLLVVFGDSNTDSGEFVFQKGIKKQIDCNSFWPAGSFGAILALDGEKTLHLSNDGMLKVVIDSGLIVYDFMILAQQK